MGLLVSWRTRDDNFVAAFIHPNGLYTQLSITASWSQRMSFESRDIGVSEVIV